ncbi:DUF881 domain-containing protein [Sporosarcina sp. G11-34]|uniref:DUF881 domain-containing protein n=1 Tax=Sporosarcina sp. G11-34 TaxID=2849605 RepID=UPI0022A9CAC8|nr:DUF881 domain-containing protein [Sporosarcina sp. G11-34]MCZ2258868.1 DUF881 domain-containing protein [Sporosarcina sp. G11-34]
MYNPVKWKFSIVLLIIGLMLAIQYNTVKNPEERDTRDIWAIRQELTMEKQLNSELLSEIRELDKTIHTYDSLEDGNTEKALTETVDKLYKQAGMTDLKGTGFVMEVRPSEESIALGIPISGITPDLLNKFVNDLNRFKGISLEIDGKRFTTLSSIRDINGITTVNGLNVSTPPFKMKVITQSLEDGEKLYNYLLASPIHDDFYLENFNLDIHKPNSTMEIRGWGDKFENRYLKELPKGE